MPELAKAYEPQQVEDRLYQKWQEGGYFRANPKSSKPPYSIVMPPPNITGKLTLGHVLNNTIQDILARKARMEGKEVLWLPGTDHAGLATQTAVEKHLRHAEKKTRHDFTREEFVARIWKWKEEFGGIITQQLRKIGCSCDWSRERFTLDKEYERAVQEVFVRLYDEGFIYRGTRMVNWCPGSLTAISDEEVIPTKQKGFLYYVKYELVPEASVSPSPRSQVVLGNALVGEAPLLPSQQESASAEEAEATKLRGQSRSQVQLWNEETQVTNFLVVATTRPETIMADAALAVKPGGQWDHLIGRQVWRPLHREQIPIIPDDAVEEGFGTGVLKVTPAHDKTDYEIGKRHKLEFRDILTPNAKIHDPGEHDAIELNGMDRFENADCCSRKSRTKTPSASANAPTKPSSPASAGNGSCATRTSGKLSPCCRKATSNFIPNTGRKFTNTGSKTSRTGASRARFGGGIASRFGMRPRWSKCWTIPSIRSKLIHS